MILIDAGDNEVVRETNENSQEECAVSSNGNQYVDEASCSRKESVVSYIIYTI